MRVAGVCVCLCVFLASLTSWWCTLRLKAFTTLSVQSRNSALRAGARDSSHGQVPVTHHRLTYATAVCLYHCTHTLWTTLFQNTQLPANCGGKVRHFTFYCRIFQLLRVFLIHSTVSRISCQISRFLAGRIFLKTLTCRCQRSVVSTHYSSLFRFCL